MSRYKSGAAIGTVGVVATGYVGSAWVAFFLARGLDVRVFVRRQEAEDEPHGAVARMWPDLGGHLAPGADPARVRVFTDLAQAMKGCDFVQENAAEQLDLKRRLLAEMDAVLPPDVLIASSTSSLPVTEMQQLCRHPERCVLGHPFTPTHLLRLVEVVGGDQTDPDAVDAAIATYAHWGKVPVRLNREVFGHIGNRLAGALWREAVSLLVEGVASAEDIDKALVEGPGRKWCIPGPFESYHLSGGSGGIRRFLETFGPGIYVSLLTWLVFEQAVESTHRNEIQDVTFFDMPVWPSCWVLVVAFGIMALVLIAQALRDFRFGLTGEGRPTTDKKAATMMTE